MTCTQFRPFIVDLARGAIDAAAVEADVERHVRGCTECRRLMERERIMSAALRRAAHVDVPEINPDRERMLMTAFDHAIAVSHRHSRHRLWLGAAAAVLLLTAAIGWRFSFVVRTGTRGSAGARSEADRSSVRPPASVHVDGPGGPPSLTWGPPSPVEVARDEVERSAGPFRRQTPQRGAAAPLRTVNRIDEIHDATMASFVAWPYAAAGPPLESGTVRRVDLPASILPALGLWPSSGETTVPVEILVGQDGFARAFRLVEE